MESKVPTIEDLKNGITQNGNALKDLLNQDPPKEWIKDSEVIEDYQYLPIDKIEYLLREIFRDYKVQITGQGTVFNAAWMTVRVHYLPKGASEWMFHDGTGSLEVNTRKSGESQSAFPILKSLAVRNACRQLGKLFGSDLNREDTIEIKSETIDSVIEKMKSANTEKEISELYKKHEEFHADTVFKIAYTEAKKNIKK